jgi:hypothetical protein
MKCHAARSSLWTGEMEMIAENPGNIVGWQSDHDGKLRVATTSDGVNQSLLYRDTEKEEFQVLQTTSFKGMLCKNGDGPVFRPPSPSSSPARGGALLS